MDIWNSEMCTPTEYQTNFSVILKNLQFLCTVNEYRFKQESSLARSKKLIRVDKCVRVAWKFLLYRAQHTLVQCINVHFCKLTQSVNESIRKCELHL